MNQEAMGCPKMGDCPFYQKYRETGNTRARFYCESLRRSADCVRRSMEKILPSELPTDMGPLGLEF